MTGLILAELTRNFRIPNLEVESREEKKSPEPDNPH
jgi:hypothetical protein